MSSLPAWQPPTLVASAKHRVLVVNRDPARRSELCGLLAPQFALEEASDGPGALRRVALGGIDAVLLAPDAVGVEPRDLIGALKKLPGHRSLPVLLTVASGQLEVAQAGLEAGADDFLVLPVAPGLLQAKVMAVLRTRDLFVEIRRQRDELERFRANAYNDYATAEKVFENILDRSCFGIPSLRKHVAPLEQFDGDLVMATPLHGGLLRFLLGDFAGHGLSAAVGAMPVADLFFATATRGVPLAAVLREINVKVQRTLPRELFLAAVVGELDPRTGRVSYWNGGQPEGFVIGADGQVRGRLYATKVPLGILDADEFDDTLETLVLAKGERLFVYSDGLVEARNPHGELFGGERLESSLNEAAQAPFATPIIERALARHRDSADRRDDVTFLEIVNDDSLGQALRELQPEPPAFMARREDALRVRLDVRALASDNPLAEVWAFLQERLGDEDGTAATVFNVVSELFLGALEQGILHLDAAMKDEADGRRRFAELRQHRLSRLREDASVDVQVQLQERDGGRRARIRLEGNGSGYSWWAAESSRPNLVSAPRAGDRVQTLLRSCCSALRVEQDGRLAEAEIDLTTQPVAEQNEYC
jgi:serine phosphatase RsbU (regulator of sigma subunit)